MKTFNKAPFLKATPLVASAVVAISAMMCPGSAKAQLFGGSGLLGGLGGPLLGGGGSQTGGSGGLGQVFNDLGLGSIGTGGSGSSLNSTLDSFSWYSGLGLSGGLSRTNRVGGDVAGLLRGFDNLGLGGGSVYTFSPDQFTSFGTSSVSARSRGTLLNTAASPFYFDWTSSGYVADLMLPSLRDFGPLGSLLRSPASISGR